MFFQYNNLAGRLIGSQQFQPYFPVGVQPAASGEPPKITFADPHTTIAKESPPPIRGTGGVVYSNVSEAIRQQQMLFQKANNLPVHLKGGQMDKILFGITVAFCGIGVLGCFKVFYDLAVPKKE